MRLCRYSRTCVKRIVNVCLTTYQIPEQSIQRKLRNEKVARTCARALCSTHNICKIYCCWSHNYTPNFCTIRPTVLEIRKRGAHVRTCSCIPSSTSAKCPAKGSLTAYQISAQSVQPLARYERGAHLHVRACAHTDYHTHDLCNMHR